MHYSTRLRIKVEDFALKWHSSKLGYPNYNLNSNPNRQNHAFTIISKSQLITQLQSEHG